MIRNQWYAVLESNEVKPGKLVGVTRMGEKLVFWRDQDGRLACMRDVCPHRGVRLSMGKLVENTLQCPFHGFRFDPSGACTLIPANGRDALVPKVFRVATYPVHEERNFIFIWWGERIASLPAVYFFDSIPPEMSYSTLRDHWPTHYSRAIENQLDVVHLPFIHQNSIGRGNRTVVDGPITEYADADGDADLLNLWVYNRVDDGKPPLKASQLPRPQRTPFLQFHFPNLWQNWISPETRIVIAFAPIDDENTLMYIRFYQGFMKVPVLRELVNWSGALANLYVERQDRRVVVTQTPKRSYLQMGEKLIQGDGPIIAYRRRREELIRQASQIEPT
jgi:phenylpropionate dioxygenase-like ring-hydroxylating dioxygenase large terminal subunit